MEQAYGFLPDLYIQWGMALSSTHFGETNVTEAGRRQSMNFGPQRLRTFKANFLDEVPTGLFLTGKEIRGILTDF